MADTKKDQSPLVQSVLALDNHFSELDRLGGKIGELEMKSDFDFEQAERLMAHFAECGMGVSTEIGNLSQQLNAARMRAEEVAAKVAERAEMLKARKADHEQKMDQFRQLGEKVRELSAAMNLFKKPEGETLTEEDRLKLTQALAEFETQLNPLIEQAQSLRKQAQLARMKFLEQNADSLAQTLQAIRLKISTMELPGNPRH